MNKISRSYRYQALLALLLVGLFSETSAAQTNQFTGTFSLPAGMLAPAGGIAFDLRTNPLDEYTYNALVAYSSTRIVVPAGQNSVSYALRLDNSPPQVNKTLEFDCVANCGQLDVTTTGWWNATQGVVGLADATTYQANTNRIINLALQGADRFAGQIVFPEGFSATGAEQFDIEVKESNFSVTARFKQRVQPQFGASSVSFLVGVPSSQTGGGWNMNIRCTKCDPELDAGPYYPSSATAQVATLSPTGQYFFLKNRDYTGLQFDLISLRRPAFNSAIVVGPISLLLLQD